MYTMVTMLTARSLATFSFKNHKLYVQMQINAKIANATRSRLMQVKLIFITHLTQLKIESSSIACRANTRLAIQVIRSFKSFLEIHSPILQ